MSLVSLVVVVVVVGGLVAPFNLQLLIITFPIVLVQQQNGCICSTMVCHILTSTSGRVVLLSPTTNDALYIKEIVSILVQIEMEHLLKSLLMKRPDEHEA